MKTRVALSIFVCSIVMSLLMVSCTQVKTNEEDGTQQSQEGTAEQEEEEAPEASPEPSDVKPIRDASADSSFMREYIILYNDYRESQGRPRLNFYPEINELALTRAADIRELGKYDDGAGRRAMGIFDSTVEYVFFIGFDASPEDLLDWWSVDGDWMTRLMLLDWYPRAGFAKVGEVAVHLFVR